MSFIKRAVDAYNASTKLRLIGSEELELTYDRLRYILTGACLVICVLFAIQTVDTSIALVKVHRCTGCPLVNDTEINTENCDPTCRTTYDRFLSPKTFSNHRKSVFVAVVISFLSLSILSFVGAYGAFMINYYSLVLFAEALTIYLTSIFVTVVWNLRKKTNIQIAFFSLRSRPFVLSMPEVIGLFVVLVMAAKLRDKIKKLLTTPQLEEIKETNETGGESKRRTGQIVFYDMIDFIRYRELMVIVQTGIAFVFFVILLIEAVYITYRAGVLSGCGECTLEDQVADLTIDANSNTTLPKCKEECISEFDAYFKGDTKNKSKRLLLGAFMLFWLAIGFLGGAIGSLMNITHLIRWFYGFLAVYTFAIYSSIVNSLTPVVLSNMFAHLFEVSIFEIFLYIFLMGVSKLLIAQIQIDTWVSYWKNNLPKTSV